MSRWNNEIIHTLMLDYNYWLAKQSVGGLFGQYWTFFVEIHFFIFALLLFTFVKDRRNRNVVMILCILLISVLCRTITRAEIIRFASHCQADSCCIGALLALNREKINNWLQNIRFEKLLRVIALLLIIVLYISPFYFDNYLNNPVIKYAFYNFISMLIMFLAIQEKNIYISRIKVLDKVLLFVGNVSASIYASHIIVFSCIAYNVISKFPILISTYTNRILCVLVLLIVAVGVGWISLILIEKPYISFSKKVITNIKSD